MLPTVLVTRPEPQASAWARQLCDAGLPAVALPLMATEGAADPTAVHALWHALAADAATADPASPSWRALMFVSPAAVQWFFQQRPAELAAMPWPSGTWLACPGLGTAQALHTALAALPPGATPPPGLPPPADAEQFDSEHLWPVLATRSWLGQRVAIISGGDAEQATGRQWLTERWQAAGAQVHTVLTYQRGAARWTPAQRDTALRAWQHPGEHLWLASSSDALRLLHATHLPALLGLAPGPSLRAGAGHRLLTTHPRIAEQAQALGWQDVQGCPPTLAGVIAAVRGCAMRPA